MTIAIKLQLAREQFSLHLDTELASTGITAIYGASGVGKTTLLRWLAGLERHPGELHFNDQCWQQGNHFTPAHRRQIGYVFQESRLLPHLNVQANLDYAWRRRCNNNGPSQSDLIDWLGLAPLLKHNTATLSGGQQQRVAIARALLSSPQLLLMDEPLAALDSASRQHILALLEQLQAHHQVPVLYISHNLEEVSQLADQLVLLEQGKISAQGSMLALCHRLDLSLSHDPNAASIIVAEVDRHDHYYGLSEVIINGEQKIYLPTVNAAVGQSLKIRIPARDVSLTLQHPEHSSILNILPCTIDAIEQSNDAKRLVRLNLGQQSLLARLTHKSVDTLALQPGQTVYAQIKTAALLSEYNRT